jgi:hypothetical protein
MASIKLAGDTSGEITISAPAVAGTTTLTLPATSSTLATQNALGVRNLIINGDMRIAQRGTSTTGVTSDGYHSVDRMRLDNTNLGTWTHSQDTDVPSGQGFTHSLKMQCTTADASPASTDLLAHNFRLEGQMLQHLKYGTSSAETLTVSFWVKSNKTGTYVVDLRHVDANLNYGKAYTIDTANTWEKKSFTFEGETTTALDNDNNQSLQLNFWLGTGSNFSSGTQNTTWSNVNADRAAAMTVNLADSTSNYINITGVQLEIGTEATPFEHRPYDMELARCQRYYQKSYNIDVAPGTNTTVGQFDHNFLNLGNYGSVNQRFGVAMRTNPTMTAYSPAGASGTIQYWDGSATQTRTTNFTIGGSHQNFYQQDTVFNHTNITFQWTADAEL